MHGILYKVTALFRFKLEQNRMSYPNRGKRSAQLTTLDIVTSAIGATAQPKLPCEVICELLQKQNDRDHQDTSMDKYDTSNTDITCNVCFMEFPSAVDNQGEVYALALKSCQHWFCRECWRHHLATQVHRGVNRIQCPVSLF